MNTIGGLSEYYQKTGENDQNHDYPQTRLELEESGSISRAWHRPLSRHRTHLPGLLLLLVVGG